MNWRAKLADWLSGGLITYWYAQNARRAEALSTIAHRAHDIEVARYLAKQALQEADND